MPAPSAPSPSRSYTPPRPMDRSTIIQALNTNLRRQEELRGGDKIQALDDEIAEVEGLIVEAEALLDNLPDDIAALRARLARVERAVAEADAESQLPERLAELAALQDEERRFISALRTHGAYALDS